MTSMQWTVPGKTAPVRGFTLLEMSMLMVALAVLALVATKTSRPNEFALSEQMLLRAESALQTYLAVNSRLPCVDSNDDGFEDCAGPQRGTLPWATLGQEAGEFRGMNLVMTYSVHSSLTSVPPGSGWGTGSASTGRFGELLVVLRDQRASGVKTQEPYLATDTPAGAMSNCSAPKENVSYAIRTVPRPVGAEPVCVQPVGGVRHTVRYMTLQGLESYLLDLSHGTL